MKIKTRSKFEAQINDSLDKPLGRSSTRVYEQVLHVSIAYREGFLS